MGLVVPVCHGNHWILLVSCHGSDQYNILCSTIISTLIIFIAGVQFQKESNFELNDKKMELHFFGRSETNIRNIWQYIYTFFPFFCIKNIFLKIFSEANTECSRQNTFTQNVAYLRSVRNLRAMGNACCTLLISS